MSTEGGEARLVSLTEVLPHAGVDNAGGQFLLHHYRMLSDLCSRVDAFAAGLPRNLAALGGDKDIAPNSYRAHVSELPRWRETLPGKVIARMFRWIFPIFPDLGIITAFTFSAKLRGHLRDADIVEFQFIENFFFARFVRFINPKVRTIGIVHDILSQRIGRKLSAQPAIVRRPYLWYIATLERFLLGGITNLAVQSPKDAELLIRLSSSSKVSVLNPPWELDFPNQAAELATAEENDSSHAAISFGFVAAFHRPENDDAALWLLDEIWPSVVRSRPEARLYIVGSKPSIELQRAAKRLGRSVEVTGYVERIEEYYRLFDTVIIPLRYGAGIKQKTVAAILAGKNIVATPIAVEGTLRDEFFYCVSDSRDELANAMIGLLNDPESGRRVAEAARVEAGTRYSRKAYLGSISELYDL